ncbi:zeta toxin family protein [Streptomyces sp. P9(2023)]|uniref:zeta toxin family protein n=1 Tax=Streptomyces sp. P9(2023) TaxID=3064394 RepID=UPI0028F45D02|nr:zeta toxin family protein [Streptomyces sp. P9(2023)]MDT9688395.1 zeta toxin family protein [Streptomyces sp. P9(2023)]
MRVTGEYEPVYRELQQRMGPGGDLAMAGEFDTRNRHAVEGLWTPERALLHDALMERFKDQCKGKPRDGHAVLFTGGAPGSGKGRAQRGLSQWESQDSALGDELRRVHGVNLDEYVVLDPDEFKVALFEQGGAPQLPPALDRLSDGRPLSPSEKASLVHRESGHVQNLIEQWARGEGYNLLYDQSLRALGWTANLLTDLQREGYDKRVLLSVEVPEQQCLEQNAARWLAGRQEFDAGRDWYGGRMAPEGFIKGLYADSTTGRGYSIGRENAEQLAERGLATGLITTDRGDFGPKAVPEAAVPAAGRAFQQGDATVRVAKGAQFMPGVNITPTRAPAPRGVPLPTTPPPPTPGPRRGPGVGL